NAMIALMETKADRGAILRAIGNRRPIVSRRALREFGAGGGDITGLKRFLRSRDGGVVADVKGNRAQRFQERGIDPTDAGIVATAESQQVRLLTRDARILNRAPEIAQGF